LDLALGIIKLALSDLTVSGRVELRADRCALFIGDSLIHKTGTVTIDFDPDQRAAMVVFPLIDLPIFVVVEAAKFLGGVYWPRR